MREQERKTSSSSTDRSASFRPNGWRDRDLRKAWLLSILIHLGVLVLFSITVGLFPKSPGDRMRWTWSPIDKGETETLRHLALPQGPQGDIGPVELAAIDKATELNAVTISESRRRQMLPLSRHRPKPPDSNLPRQAEPGLNLPQSPAALKDPPAEPGSFILTETRLEAPIPALKEIPIPRNAIPDWVREPLPSKTSAGSLGVTGPPALLSRRVLAHSAPPKPPDVASMPVAFRFSVTPSGRVTDVVPERLDNSAFNRAAYLCLLGWRFEPLPEPGLTPVMKGQIVFRP